MATKKPVAKKAAPKPAAKPVAKAAPAKKAAPKPAAKPVAKAAPAKKVALKPAAKPVAKAAPAKKVAPKPVAKPVAKAAPAKKEAPKPVAKVAPVKKEAAKPVAPVKVAAKPIITEPPIKETQKPVKIEKVKKEPKPKKVKVKKPAKITRVVKHTKPTKIAGVEKATTVIPVKKIEAKPKDVPLTKEVKVPKTSVKTSIAYTPNYTPMERREPQVLSSEPLVRYNDTDLNEFRDLIAKKLEASKKELAYLQGLITRKDETGGDNEDGRYMTMEDGSLSMEKEQHSQLASRQITFIDHLEKALIRIENKTYGICRVTGKLIDKARLRAVPHATLSLEAKLGLVKAND
jgi:RNA polymerase-binding transcription factor DksA